MHAVSHFCIVPLTCGSTELQRKDNHMVMEHFQFHVPRILLTYTFNLALGMAFFFSLVFFVLIDYWAASAFLMFPADSFAHAHPSSQLSVCLLGMFFLHFRRLQLNSADFLEAFPKQLARRYVLCQMFIIACLVNDWYGEVKSDDNSLVFRYNK